MTKNINLSSGYIDEKIDFNLDLTSEIKKLCKQKNAVILAHFYQRPEVQDIADFIGDSLKLAQEAAKTDADIILFAGVHFMAETAKILSPQKKVLLPDLNAGCSLADSAPFDEFKEFKKLYPNHVVVSYVNTTAELKTLTDIVCTSSNARQVIDSIPKEKGIIFAPDKNLGTYINQVTGRNMILWDGACHVHSEFSIEKIKKLQDENPDALLISHPECKKELLFISNHIGSTSSLLNFTKTSKNKKFIVATESGIIHQMQKANPEKIFIAAPPEDTKCACNDCEYMKMNTMEKIYLTLKYELPEIILDRKLIEQAKKPIIKMLELSK